MAKSIKKKRKKKLGSYPWFSVVFSITLALIVIGLFAFFLLATQKLAGMIQENIEIQAYLEKNLGESEKIAIDKTLRAKEYTLVKEGEPQVVFISKEDALKDFTDKTGEDPVAILGENPLRDAFAIKVKPSYQDSLQFANIQNDIETISGVFEATYAQSLIGTIQASVKKISIGMITFSIILLFTAVFLIHNTIKLALFSQRFLIRSMQLIGAKAGFIKKPFVLRSVLHGLTAGVFASALIYLLINLGYKEIAELKEVLLPMEVLMVLGILLILGILIGFLSTLSALGKYLKMSLNDLY